MKKIIYLICSLTICSLLKAQVPPPPLQPGEHWTNLYSVSYDYQSNGSVRYIVQNPNSVNGLCAILMAQQDSSTFIGTKRYIYYSYSFDNGITWSARVLDTSANYGFPCIALRNGIPIITAHKSSALGSFVFQDASFGAFNFQPITPAIPPHPSNINPIWPHITGTSNGNIVLAASLSPDFIGYYVTYNGVIWSMWTELGDSTGGPSGEFSVEAGANGIVGIFGINFNSNNFLYYFKSTDNGVTFNPGTLVFNYFIDGNDTLYANVSGGFQAVYVNEEPHLVFAAYNVNANAVFPNQNTIAYIKPKILHWTPSAGITQVAGKFNIPNLTDTITTALMAPVGQPSLGTIGNGKLICSFTTFLRGNKQIVLNGDTVNAGEIFYSTSTNNGVNWSTPVNATNTPSIEEKHPSLIRQNTSDSMKCFYVRDMVAGGYVNVTAWGKGPVYGIYKIVPAVVGINENISQANSFKLHQNYPNPFNPKTIINYDIVFPLNKGGKGVVSLKVYDALGKEVATLVNEKQNAGSYEIEFDGNNLPSGIYYYKLTAGDFVDTKAMVLIK